MSLDKFKKLLAFDKRKFVISVGDEGAILVLVNGSKLEKRVFISAPNSDELNKTLTQFPTTPVYMLIDVLDQAYIQHTLPPVSPLNIGQIVKRRLEKDFAEEDIKAALKLNREKTGRKDWNYLFVSLSNAPPFSDWVDSVAETPNPFAGIYLLPIEMERFLRKFNLAISKKQDKKPEDPPKWQFLVSHNKVGGFRQIVFKDRKIVFTRIAQPIGGLEPDVIAGNIEQETLNTIEYVRRLGFDEEEGSDIVVITSDDVRKALESSSLQARDIKIFTPFEVAELLKLNDAAEQSDRFGDVVLAANFANSKKKILKLFTPYTKKLQAITQGNLFLRIFGGLAIPALVIMAVMTLFDNGTLQDDIEKAEKAKREAQEYLSKVKTVQKNFSGDSQKIVEIVKLDKTFNQEVYLPLELVKNFSTAKGIDAKVKSLNLDITESLEQKDTANARFTTELSSISNTIDRLLEDVDLFTENIRQKFSEYDVQFQGLPSESDKYNLDLDDGSGAGIQTVSLEIVINGPKEQDNKPKTKRRRR